MQLIVHATNGIEFSVGRMQLLVFQMRVLTLRLHQSTIDDTLNDKTKWENSVDVVTLPPSEH